MSRLYDVIRSLSPALYARFSETSGATCGDSSGNGLTGTADGTYTRNVAGGTSGDDDPAIHLGATGSYVTFGQPAAIDFTTSMSARSSRSAPTRRSAGRRPTTSSAGGRAGRRT